MPSLSHLAAAWRADMSDISCKDSSLVSDMAEPPEYAAGNVLPSAQVVITWATNA